MAVLMVFIYDSYRYSSKKYNYEVTSKMCKKTFRILSCFSIVKMTKPF